MAKTRPICVRLDLTAHEQLKARAYQIQGTPAGVARQLILSGLAGAQPEALARRLMAIDRKMAANEALLKDTAAASSRLHSMFEALLDALAHSQRIPAREAAE
jgi:hypothetical protein